MGLRRTSTEQSLTGLAGRAQIGEGDLSSLSGMANLLCFLSAINRPGAGKQINSQPLAVIKEVFIIKAQGDPSHTTQMWSTKLYDSQFTNDPHKPISQRI